MVDLQIVATRIAVDAGRVGDVGAEGGRGSVVAVPSQRKHHGQCGADAGRPADPEHCTEQRRAGQPGRRPVMEADLALQRAKQSHERHADDDGRRAQKLFNSRPVHSEQGGYAAE
jgi:hypothetical protein